MRTVADIGELGLLARIRDWTRADELAPPAGLGDDAAVLATDGTPLVLTVDILAEGVDFDRRYAPWELVGRKAAAVNLSDVAAMGAEPAALLVALSVPASMPIEDVADLFKGLQYRADRAHARIIGGDLSEPPAGDAGLTITVTAVGRARERPATRAGARPGDRVCVTGTFGDSALGLRLLRDGRADSGVDAAYVCERHLDPEPRLECGAALAGKVHAMIDVSDGLAVDLGHVLEASGAGATIDLAEVPRSDAFRNLAPDDAESLILHGGEDYELLFTWPAEQSLPDSVGNIPLHAIGTVTAEPGLRVRGPDGAERTVTPTGWEHFHGRGSDGEH